MKPHRDRASIVALSLTSLGALCLCSACAGPTTPLGTPWITSASEVTNGPLSLLASVFSGSHQTQITFWPRHQNLHGPGPLAIRVHDPAGVKSNYRLLVLHNGIDVTASFLRQAQLLVDGTELLIRVPLVRLPPDRDHRIEVVYGGGGTVAQPGEISYARYEPPSCRAFGAQPIASTQGFAPPSEMIEQIRKLSALHGFNPVFTAGLIAQESAFEPRTVSWAKAIGLTQITSSAEDEIIAEYDDWPRYPGINDLPTAIVKILVATGNANGENEWRLDSERSIEGGLLFLEMLAEHWSDPPNRTRVRAAFPDSDAALTRLILASYNSGYTRVTQAFARDGTAWLSDPELREARKYVNRVMSYCDRFSEKGGFL